MTMRIPLALVQSGDLLAWRKDSHSTMSDWLIHAIRDLTRSKYGHVGIAWRCHDGISDELFVIEATMPKIRVARLLPDHDFDCIPMGVPWIPAMKDFLVEKIGLPYSPLDAVRAYFGLKLKRDDNYQCVELAHYFYEMHGIVLEHNFTPGGIVEAAEKYANTKAQKIIAPLEPSLVD